MKKILIDLDGVLNVYDGIYDEGVIPPLRKNAREFLCKLCKDYELIIFSTRDSKLIIDWLTANNLQEYVSLVTNIKLPAFVHIDDGCITFNGNYDETIEQIKNFKPHWRKNK